MSDNLNKMLNAWVHLLEVRDEFRKLLKSQDYDDLPEKGKEFVRDTGFLHNDLDNLIQRYQPDFMEYERENN